MPVRYFNRRRFLEEGFGLTITSSVGRSVAIAAQSRDARGAISRHRWLDWMERVAEPVLRALANRELRQMMPVRAAPGHEVERAVGSPLEATGRLLMGMAPWLELEIARGESKRETALRDRYRSWAQDAIASVVDPKSPDYMQWGESNQTLVDASFLSLGLMRAPRQLIATMSAQTRQGLIAALLAERKIVPGPNNWVLFSALDEAMLFRLGADWDRVRVRDALNDLSSWYLGDGIYGDGPRFHADNYNSFVMHPYMLMLMQVIGDQENSWKELRPVIESRAARYAAIQERMIAPDGSFPVVGRSVSYRAGAFHLLADACLRGSLAANVRPAQVRCGLTAVQERTLDAPGTFDAKGWLRIGLAGWQPSLGETYISTGSLYLCSAAWLPLGLPPTDAFWTGSEVPWSQKKIWAGEDAPADHALD